MQSFLLFLLIVSLFIPVLVYLWKGGPDDDGL